MTQPTLGATTPREPGITPGRQPEPLDDDERGRLRVVRRFGLAGALLMGVAALGAGTAPVLNNPANGIPILGVLPRMPTASLAVAYTGMFMVVIAWLWLGALTVPGRSRSAGTGQIIRTLAMWSLPLAVAPPMFSRDVYSYLAQSAQAALGLNPYVFGPAEALGVDHPLVRGIPTVWRNTPAPYGPLFLTLGRPVIWITGQNVVLGTIGFRILALAGVVMIVWALPRLARRVGVSPAFALWLGAANPLVLFHMVSGVHAEALMVGLMLVGLEFALRRPELGVPVLVGTVVITASAMIKIPSALALGFVGVWVAAHRGRRIRDLAVVAAALGAVATATTLSITYGSGLGFGWIAALDVPGNIYSWMSVSTDLGLLAGHVGAWLGLGDHTTTALLLTRGLGFATATVVCAVLLWRCWRGRLEPLTGLGIGLGAVVLLGPVVHPWYMLWAVVPLAASAMSNTYRVATVGISVVMAVVVAPTGAGFDFRAWVLPTAVIAGVLGLLVPLALAWRHAPDITATLRRA